MSNIPSNLVNRLRGLWKRIEPGTDDVVLMTQVSAVIAEAAKRLELLEGEHENITRGRIPTHHCKACGTFWIDLGHAWTMCGISCGPCCDVPSNIEKLPALRPVETDGKQPEPGEGHGKPCYYCQKPCNGLAGNPSEWPIALCHPDEPGKVKWHHTGCVSDRLHGRSPEETKDKPEKARVHEESSNCWCQPSLDYTNPETGAQHWIHHEPN